MESQGAIMKGKAFQGSIMMWELTGSTKIKNNKMQEKEGAYL